MTARLVRDSPVDPGEVGEDRLLGELLEMRAPVRAAGEPGGDHRPAEQLQRPRDVDALAAGDGPRLDRAVATSEPEVRDGDGPVDRRVERHGKDHCGSSCPIELSLRRRRRAGMAPTAIASPDASAIAAQCPSTASTATRAAPRKVRVRDDPAAGTERAATSGTDRPARRRASNERPRPSRRPRRNGALDPRRGRVDRNRGRCPARARPHRAGRPAAARRPRS